LDINLGGITATIDLSTGNLDQNLDNAKRGLELVEIRFRSLQQQLQAGTYDFAKYTDNVQALVDTKKQLVDVINTATRVQKGFHQTLDDTGNKMRGIGQFTQGTGRIVQDFVQGGLGGIINNLEQVGTAGSRVAGLAPAWGYAIGGALTIAGTAVLLLYNNWDKFMHAMGMRVEVPIDTSSLEGMQDRLGNIKKEIAEIQKRGTVEADTLVHHNRLLEERLRLERGIKDARAVEQVKNEPTQREKDAAAAFDKTLGRMKFGVEQETAIDEALTNASTPLRRSRQVDADAAGLKEAQEAYERGAKVYQSNIGGGFSNIPMNTFGAKLPGGFGYKIDEDVQQFNVPGDKTGDVFTDPGKARQRLIRLAKEGNEEAISFIEGIGNDFAKALTAARSEDLVEKADKLATEVAKAMDEAGEKAQKAVDKADKEAQRQAEKDAAMSEQQEERLRKDKLRESGEIAKGMMKGEAGYDYLMHPDRISEEDVANRMRETGRSEAEIEELAAFVWEHLTDALDEQVRNRAYSEGISEDQARNELLAERDKAAADKERKQEHEAGREVSQQFPGIEAQIRAAMLSQLVRNPQEDPDKIETNVRGQLRNQLIDAGTPAGIAVDAARQLSRMGMVTIQREIEAESLKANQRRTEIIGGGTALNERLQTSIGGFEDVPSQQLKELGRIREALDKQNNLVEQDVNNPRPVVLGRR
jgi:hypothetical protein